MSDAADSRLIFDSSANYCTACDERMEWSQQWDYFGGKIYHATGSCGAVVKRLRERVRRVQSGLSRIT